MGLLKPGPDDIRQQAIAATGRGRTVFTIRVQHKPDSRGADNRLDQLVTAVENGDLWRLDSIIALGGGDHLLLLFRPGTSARPV